MHHFSIVNTLNGQEGVTTTTSYGLAVAKTVRFPQSVLERAIEHCMNFEAGDNNLEVNKICAIFFSL